MSTLGQVVAATQLAHPGWSFQKAWDFVTTTQPELSNTCTAEENRIAAKAVRNVELEKHKADFRLEVKARLLMEKDPRLTFGAALRSARGPMPDKSQGRQVLVTAQYAEPMPLDGQPPAVIQYMPAGKTTINPSVNGRSKEITVNVTERTAAALQADLQKLLRQNVRPYVDFDHVGGAAAALPKRFYWTEEGVMMEIDWTNAGKTAVSGRDYSYFSPTFLLNERGDPSGLPPSSAIGSLVNNPAFRSIRRIAAHQ
jgi:hypothetical protein